MMVKNSRTLYIYISKKKKERREHCFVFLEPLILKQKNQGEREVGKMVGKA
jgi:hypothetical protein